jgi:hypothetical protein
LVAEVFAICLMAQRVNHLLANSTDSVATFFAVAETTIFVHHFTTALTAVPQRPKEKTSNTALPIPTTPLTHLSHVPISLPFKSFPLNAIPTSYTPPATGIIHKPKSAASVASADQDFSLPSASGEEPIQPNINA